MDNKVHNFVEKITGAIFLIFIGCILLLNTTGTLPWSIWGAVFSTFFKVWPVFLIFAGFQIIFSGNQIAKSIFNILWTILIMGIFVLAILSSTGRFNLPDWFNNVGWNFSFTDVKSVTQSQELKFEDYQNVSNLTYKFNVQAGDFNISSSDSTNAYLAANSEFKENIGVPKTVAEQSDSDMSINFTQEFKGMTFGTNKLNYDIVLDSNDLPTKFDAEVTAGDFNADLTVLKLTDLKFVMTAGNANIKVGEGLESASVKVTAGKLTLLVPTSYRLKITANSTAGDIRVDSTKISSGSTVINSAGTKTLELDLTQTAGEIEIGRI